MASAASIPDLQKKAFAELNKALIEGLEKGEISADEMRASARYIDYHLHAVESFEELLLLIEEVGNRWPVYKKVFITLKHQETASDDAEKMQALQEKLRQYAASVA